MNELNEIKDWIKIGSGQFGKVYKAIYNESQTIAIKVNINKICLISQFLI